MRLLMLTFVRTGELRCSTWDEFDLDGEEWRIPAHRMKMREAHTVPLSRQVLELLKELYTITGHQKWLFPNVRRPITCMTATTLNRVIERIGYKGKFSAHGFRGTASKILNELGYQPDVIEKQLAHSDRNNVRASYNQAQYIEERKKMMQLWADYLDGLKAGAKVIPITRKAA
jgi:integrase